MIVKIVIAAVVVLATLVLFRQISERHKRAAKRIKDDNHGSKKS